jgi:hypothetical protein
MSSATIIDEKLAQRFTANLADGAVQQEMVQDREAKLPVGAVHRARSASRCRRSAHMDTIIWWPFSVSLSNGTHGSSGRRAQ